MPDFEDNLKKKNVKYLITNEILVEIMSLIYWAKKIKILLKLISLFVFSCPKVATRKLHLVCSLHYTCISSDGAALELLRFQVANHAIEIGCPIWQLQMIMDFGRKALTTIQNYVLMCLLVWFLISSVGYPFCLPISAPS